MNISEDLLGFVQRSLIQSSSGCWLWIGGTGSMGYGRVRINGGRPYVHRLVYEEFKGKIPQGLVLDHLCRTPSCCNPRHLEAVSHRVNLLRGRGVAARHAATTHCPYRHEYTKENTHTYRGSRFCKKCFSRRHAKAKAKKLSLLLSEQKP